MSIITSIGVYTFDRECNVILCDKINDKLCWRLPPKLYVNVNQNPILEDMKFIFQQWLGPYNDFWKVWQVCFNLNFCRLSYFRRSQWLKNTFSVAAAKTRYTAILDPWKIYSSDQECTIIEVVFFIGHNFCRRSQFMQKIWCSCQLKSVWS